MRVGMGLSRDQEIDYANDRGIEIPITKASPYSIDVNLWGRSCETGVLEDPWVAPPADAYEWTVEPGAAPAPVEIVIDFEGGVPVALDGERLDPVDLIERLHALGGRPRRRPDRPRRGPPGRDQEPRDLRDARGDDPARGPSRAGGPDPVQGHPAVRPAGRRRAGPADLRRAVVQRPPPRPARLRGVVPAGRQRRCPDPAGSRLGDRRRATLTAVALRQEPGDLRRGRRLRPCRRGRVHRDLRPAAAGRGGPPRRGRPPSWRGLVVDGPAARYPADDRRVRRGSSLRGPNGGGAPVARVRWLRQFGQDAGRLRRVASSLLFHSHQMEAEIEVQPGPDPDLDLGLGAALRRFIVLPQPSSCYQEGRGPGSDGPKARPDGRDGPPWRRRSRP